MATFTVEAAEKQERMDQRGDPVPMYVVWLRTAKGGKGRLEVPADVWEGDGLREYLEAQAANLDKAFDLINGG